MEDKKNKMVTARQTSRTKRAIYSAFSELLNRKKYSQIAIREIADLADVGRSTVYSHFETKEDILTSMCREIFENLLAAGHVNSNDTQAIIVALFTHIKENKKVITGIFSSEGTDVFVEFCNQYFGRMLEAQWLEGYDVKTAGIPKDYLVNYLIGTFMETIRWWAKNGMKQPPEEIAGYFVKITNGAINP